MLNITNYYCSVTKSCLTLWPRGLQHANNLPVLHYLPEFAQLHWVGDAIQPSHPLSSPSPLAFNLSQPQGLFQWVSSSHQVAKYWYFTFSISPFNEYSGLISFRMDWLDLLAVQGTLKSLLQHHSSKASILRRSAFFIVQLSHPYMTTGKTVALTRRTFVGKVVSLLFNMLSRLVITFLPRSQFFASGCQSIGFSISPSSEYSGLISFRMDWLDLLAVQGTLKSILQHHGSKASILLWSAFFIVQLWHPWLLVKPSLWLDEPLLAK